MSGWHLPTRGNEMQAVLHCTTAAVSANAFPCAAHLSAACSFSMSSSICLISCLWSLVRQMMWCLSARTAGTSMSPRGNPCRIHCSVSSRAHPSTAAPAAPKHALGHLSGCPSGLAGQAHVAVRTGFLCLPLAL
jgi:hypothetical protein